MMISECKAHICKVHICKSRITIFRKIIIIVHLCKAHLCKSPFMQSPHFIQSPFIQSPFMQSPYMQSPYQYMQSPYHHINEDYRQNSLMKMLPMLLMDKIKLAKTNNNVFNNLAGAGVIQVSQRNSKDDWARVTPPNSQIGKNINFQDYVRKDYAVAKLDKINKQISNYIMKRNEDMFNHYHH
eukprot:TRINITY_DN3361_c0_g1_i1.p1 TRINITY_DN3361_c0_g1~~TRINITY_DN3361_c0_g1_i1.p1  ORF type:complete len:183 (-),score=0.40 TRINITY_DN3361_c0_g1_i1:236-784(-)